MENTIEKAIELRKAGHCDKSRELLFKIPKSSKLSPLANLHIAWSYDVEGKEADAVKYYKNALQGKLNDKNRVEALIGLASTLRCLGKYSEAIKYFEIAAKEYPQMLEFKPFHAMCLYNLGRNKEAVAMLLELVLETTNSNEILGYKKAIALYAKDLDAKW